MGYPNYGKVKTIVLPIPKSVLTGTPISFEDYKKNYGIDLADIIGHDVGFIEKIPQNANFYLSVNLGEYKSSSFSPNFGASLLPCIVAPSDDGTTLFLTADFYDSADESMAGIHLLIDPSTEELQLQA